MGRCSACPDKHKCIPADGLLSAKLVFIGEGPGYDEDRKGRVFVGKTGREVKEGYFPHAGLKWHDAYVTNAIKCYPDRTSGKLDINSKKDLDLLQSCADCHLYKELEQIRPQLIIPMGAFACYAIDPSINLELQHGFPVKTAWGTAFPMYHPAGGIHEPKKMLQIRTDWGRLRKYLRGTLTIPRDPYAGRERYMEAETTEHVDMWMANRYHQPIGNDTEITRTREPFCLTASTEPGTGFLIRAKNKPILKRYQWHIERWEGPILWHNWLFDGDVVQSMEVTDDMGLVYQERLIIDTMQRAFHLGNIPQGLKALSYRLMGMRMQDFDDLVAPYSTERVLDYYRAAKLEDWPKPEEFLYRSDEGKWKLKKPQGMNTKLKRFFTDYSKNEEKDVFGMWTKNWEDEQAMMEAKLGPWPGKCITHVPFEQVLHYACRDADATLRLWPILKQAARNVRRKPEADWYEAA